MVVGNSCKRLSSVKSDEIEFVGLCWMLRNVPARERRLEHNVEKIQTCPV
jgi:hypothetical protein